ncbi:Pikfyve, partial [Symbiodinium sp. KB8]
MGVLKDKKWKRPQDLPNAIRYDWEQDMDNAGLRTILNTPVLKEPVKVDFEDKQAKYHVAIHFAPHYHALRHWICGDDLNFVRSLQHCNPIQTSGGKSRATFLMSHDKRFLLKAINESEFKKLNSEAENLFWYFDKVLFDKWPSVLTQVIGLFSVSATKKSQNYKGYYVVQQNLRYSLRGTWAFIFDLKGTGKNRRVQATDLGEEPEAQESPSGSRAPEDENTERDRAGKVFWDQNFREWTKGKPLCLVPSDLTYLEAAIFNDTTLLSTRELMDYSLLLAAVPPEPGATAGRLILGMIDYLRAFTIDKKVESAVKTALAPTPSEQPTIIAPKDYAARFMRAMSTYFVADCPEARAVVRGDVLPELHAAIRGWSVDVAAIIRLLHICGQRKWLDEVTAIQAAVQDLEPSQLEIAAPVVSGFCNAAARCLSGLRLQRHARTTKCAEVLDRARLLWQAWAEHWQEGEACADFDTALASALLLCDVVRSPTALVWAEEIWEQAKAQAVPRTVDLYLAMLSILEWHRRYDAVDGMLLQDMVEDGLTPNEEVLEALLTLASNRK